MYFSTLSLLSLARLEKFQFQPPEKGRSEIVGVERRSTHLAAHCLPSSCGAASGALPSGGRQRQTFRGRAVGCFSRVEILTDMPVMVYPFLFISQMRLSRSSAPSTAIHVHVSSIVLDFFRFCGDKGTRTLDPLLAGQVLYPSELYPRSFFVSESKFRTHGEPRQTGAPEWHGYLAKHCSRPKFAKRKALKLAFPDSVRSQGRGSSGEGRGRGHIPL